MGERNENEQDTSGEPAEGQGQRIPGRDFAGGSYASNEREQTADHRLESDDYTVDEAPDTGEGRPDRRLGEA